jgi:polyphosphate glucokinase
MPQFEDSPMKVLVVDIGGTHVKIMATGHGKERKAESGPTMSAREMVDAVLDLAGHWKFKVVSMGYPGPVVHGKPVLEPKHLAPGWVGFDFAGAFGRPVKVVNDALMQAVGSYQGGRMLFLGLGTGLGSAMVVENVAQPMELAHLPYKDGRTFEQYLGEAALEQMGQEAWRREVAAVVARLQAALEPEYVVLGGGNVRLLEELPPGCRRGDNKDAFAGGFRLWGDDAIKL